MGFWDEYLKSPPSEVRFPASWDTNPEDYHCVRWVGYGGEYEADKLWDFGSGSRWMERTPPEMNFTKYGGETLCGLKIESGQNMYGPRWRSIRPRDYHPGSFDEDDMREVLIDLHGITCMVCRKKLMYGICQLIGGLTSVRNQLGEEYVSQRPLIHGKHVISRDNEGRITGETYRLCCDAASEAINPQLASDAEEFDRITCPDCIANIEASRE